MKTRQIVTIIVLLFLSIQVFSQSSIDDFVKEGIKYHDKGDFDKAISTYEKALEINSKSLLVNYEIALSYFSKRDYKKVIKYSDVILNQNSEYMLQAYMTKGSALDMLGETKSSVKLFEKAIKKIGEHYLLYYNLSLNYYKLNNLDKAEENVIRAIKNNSNHASSHLMLANIHERKGNPVQTLLATHYFLFLEPNTKRAIAANKLLQKNFGGNVSKDKNKPNTININLPSNRDSPFSSVELMISMLEASKALEENENKTEEEMFIENTESFFKILGELKKKKNKEIWWTFYTTFFYDLAKSEHLTTYCKYITQSNNKKYKDWQNKNKDKLVEFGEWLKK